MDVVFQEYWRLEPRVRPDGSGGNLAEAMQARVHDPLWALGRQWQLGELRGEDAGSPIATVVHTRSAPLSRFRGLGPDAQDYHGELPLEMLVEHEPARSDDDVGRVPGTVSLRDRARAGLALLERIEAGPARERIRAALVAKFPLEPAIAGLARRSPDGVELARRVRGGDTIEELPPDDRAALAAALDGWLEWFAREIMDDTPDCWLPRRLEYAFSVGGTLDDRAVGLHAPEFRGGSIDWYHLDIDHAKAELLGLAPGAEPAEERETRMLPVRATFPGMPVNRWWEIEDGRVNLARIDAGPLDLARLLLVEFTAVYGNDWFVIPVPLKFGTISVLGDVIVTNTFGERFLMPRSDRDATPWSMYRHTAVGGNQPDPDLLSLLPVIPAAHDGDPLEEVLFLRDETANLAWGVVKVQQGPDGRASRVIGAAPPAGPAPATAPVADLRYELESEVPPALGAARTGTDRRSAGGADRPPPWAGRRTR